MDARSFLTKTTPRLSTEHAGTRRRALTVAGFGVELHARSRVEDAGRWSVAADGPGTGVLAVWRVPSPGRSDADDPNPTQAQQPLE